MGNGRQKTKQSFGRGVASNRHTHTHTYIYKERKQFYRLQKGTERGHRTSMKTMCTMLPLFFCIYRRQQPFPLTIIPLHCHHPLGSYARRIFRLLWAATWWTSGHRDVKSPLCSKGSFPLFLLRLCLSGYLQRQCRADRICRDIRGQQRLLGEKRLSDTFLLPKALCVIFRRTLLRWQQRTCLCYSYCPASLCSSSSHTQ